MNADRQGLDSLPVCVMKMCNSKTDATVAKECGQIQVVQTIPMSLWKRESCSAEASMIPESHLHCTK